MTSDTLELTALDAVELRALYRRRELSPCEVLDAVLQRIERFDGVLHAFVTLTAELAVEQAKQAEATYARGDGEDDALLGVPISIKDTIATKGIRTTMGSRLLAEWVPEIDAPAAERSRDAGAVLLGKTNTPEFGWKGETSNPLFGTTVNPWNVDLTPGGSSGGAAAAVAAGFGALALGTDAAGSTRIPAAFCGLVGLKPSFGRIPAAPGGTLETLGHIGLLTRSVRDAAMLLDVLAGADPRDRLSLPSTDVRFGDLADAPVRGLRVAWSVDLGYAPVESEIVDIVSRAVLCLGDAGCELDTIDAGLDDPYDVVQVLLAAGNAGPYRDNFSEVRNLIDPHRIPVIESGFRLSAADVGAAIARRAQWSDQMRRLIEPYDVLVTPTLPLAAFAAGLDGPSLVAGHERPGLSWAPFSYPFNLTGQPAISLPCGSTASGLPVGLQIIGRWHDDATVLRVAAAFEARQPELGRPHGANSVFERATN